MKRLFAEIELQPKLLFILDGVGAMLSAFLLGVVLVRLEKIFGLPSSTLYFLATLPIIFAIYDFLSYRKINSKGGRLLRGIGTMNLVYCLLSIGLAFYHTKTITSFGWTYILVEVSIVMTLAIMELRMANRLKKGRLDFVD